MHDDFYQMYIDELAEIPPCGEVEEAQLLQKIADGDEAARTRLTEGMLGYVAQIAKDFADRGLPMGDLVQEANIALMMAVNSYEEGVFRSYLKAQVEAVLESALEEQKQEKQVEEEILARINVLKDIAQNMAEELGREASVEELAERMKMTTEEIKGIMKLTLDAMSVSPDAE